MPAAENEAIVRRVFDAFAQKRGFALRDVFAEDATWVVPGGGTMAGTFRGRVYLIDPTANERGQFRILVEPDHRTTLATRAHAYGAVAFAAAGTGIAATAQTTYDEPTAEAGDLSFDPGFGLMSWFLGR